LRVRLSAMYLLGKHLVTGVAKADHVHNCMLGIEVGVGDEVGDVLGSHDHAISEVARDDGTTGPGSLLRNTQFGHGHAGVPRSHHSKAAVTRSHSTARRLDVSAGARAKLAKACCRLDSRSRSRVRTKSAQLLAGAIVDVRPRRA